MKRMIYACVLAGYIALLLCGCGGKKEEALADQPGSGIEREEVEPEKAETEEAEAEEAKQEEFSFADFRNLEFWFCSGAGGWATILYIEEDGSFSGEWFDGELGVTGEDYPNGTIYRCDFTGQFTHPVKVNEYTYSMQISEMNYARKVGEEEIKDGVLYCYGSAYGLDDAENILIYLPGAPLKELSQEFRSWVGYYDLTSTADTELPFYALNNEASDCGFYSCDLIEEVKQDIRDAEDQAEILETSIQEETLTQAELNEKTQELYELWDRALNNVWTVLKRTKDAETMSLLTIKEREWIAQKEEAVQEAAAEFEGGSIQPMIRNQKAAEMTKIRVYELMELLDGTDEKE